MLRFTCPALLIAALGCSGSRHDAGSAAAAPAAEAPRGMPGSSVVVIQNGVELNGTKLLFPIALSDLKAVLKGAVRNLDDKTYVWDDAGIAAYIDRDSGAVAFIEFKLASEREAAVDPDSLFLGTVVVGKHRLSMGYTVEQLKRDGLAERQFPPDGTALLFHYDYLGASIAFTPEDSYHRRIDDRNSDQAKIAAIAIENSKRKVDGK
jgi:hypothetical protein